MKNWQSKQEIASTREALHLGVPGHVNEAITMALQGEVNIQKSCHG